MPARRSDIAVVRSTSFYMFRGCPRAVAVIRYYVYSGRPLNIILHFSRMPARRSGRPLYVYSQRPLNIIFHAAPPCAHASSRPPSAVAAMSAATTAAIRARLTTVRAVLESLTDTAQRAAASRAQAGAVVCHLNRASGQLTDEDKAVLVTMAVDVPWEPADATRVLQAISPPTTARRQLRRTLQDFTSFLDFCTEADWASALSEDVTVPGAVLNVFFKRLVRLGCRTKDENTMKLLNSAWLLITDKTVDTWSAEALQKSKAHVSREFLRFAERAPDPLVFMTTLPKSPQELLREVPSMYAIAFSSEEGDGPARCPLLPQRLQGLNASYRCRGGRGVPTCPTIQLASPQDLARGSSMHGLEQFGRMMMEGMREIQQSQQAAFQWLITGGGPPMGANQRGGTLLNLSETARRGSGVDNPGAVAQALWQNRSARAIQDGSAHVPSREAIAGDNLGGTDAAAQPTTAPLASMTSEVPKTPRLKDSVREALEMLNEKGSSRKKKKKTKNASTEKGEGDADGKKKRKRAGKAKVAAQEADASEDDDDDDEKNQEEDGADGDEDADDSSDCGGRPRAGTAMKSVKAMKSMQAMKSKSMKAMKSTKAIKSMKAAAPHKHRIDWSDLIQWTPAAKLRTKESFGSSAYHAVIKRAADRKMSPEQSKEAARAAYRDAVQLYSRRYRK